MIPVVFGSSLPSPTPPSKAIATKKCRRLTGTRFLNGSGSGSGNGFPPFLPKEVENIKDPYARNLAQRMDRLPVQMRYYESCIMSSCVRPLVKTKNNPVVLLHCFDRCLPCNLESKRLHLYQFWKSYIRRPMILVGPSLCASVAIDFAVSYPFAVEKLVLINASVYTEGNKGLAELPRVVAYAGVFLLRSMPFRLYANMLAFNDISFVTTFDWTNVGRLHCLLPWWKDATVQQKALIICSEKDRIISYKQTLRLCCELPSAIMWLIPDGGHLPHVDNPSSVANLIAVFARNDRC